VQLVDTPSRKRYPRSYACQQMRKMAAKAARCTRDENDAAVEAKAFQCARHVITPSVATA
jgi:hypothetical protein